MNDIDTVHPLDTAAARLSIRKPLRACYIQRRPISSPTIRPTPAETPIAVHGWS